jgi:hypothetical protein
MSIQRFFLDGFGNDEELASLKESDAFPLVRELEFKFGLKVLRHAPIHTDYGQQGAFQLCNKFGIAIAKVWTQKNFEGKMEYCYRSPYYKKERGATPSDKETIRSVKISSLIATLTRHDVVPAHDVMVTKKVAMTKQAIDLMRRHMGESYKTQELSPTEIHALIAQFLGQDLDSRGLSIDINKCKNTLDKYDEADRIRDKKVEEVRRAFANPYYMIGVDELGHHIIGKFRLVMMNEANDSFQYITEEPFKRYATIEDCPELVSLMTMVKVAYETNNTTTKHYGYPLTDKYDENLDMTFFYHQRPTHYDCLWMTTPC